MCWKDEGQGTETAGGKRGKKKQGVLGKDRSEENRERTKEIRGEKKKQNGESGYPKKEMVIL